MKQFLVFLFALVATQTASAATVTVLTPTVLRGQTIVVKSDIAPTSATFDGKTVTAFAYQNSYRIIVPLTLSAKVGGHTLVLNFPDSTITKTITILNRKQPVIVLPVPEKLNETPHQLVQNLSTSNTSINKSIVTVSPTRFSVGFGLPLYDNRKIGSPFGEIRQTGEERITHLGTDFGGAKGSYVAAINAGVVTSAYLDPTYGNSVFVDHGDGIYSLYLHLDSMKVKAGDAVKKGQQVGTLGETGLASAPHLHLSIKINGQSVDPLQFVSAFK